MSPNNSKNIKVSLYKPSVNNLKGGDFAPIQVL